MLNELRQKRDPRYRLAGYRIDDPAGDYPGRRHQQGLECLLVGFGPCSPADVSGMIHAQLGVGSFRQDKSEVASLVGHGLGARRELAGAE